MTEAISGADRLVAMLRQRLRERAAADAPRPTARQGGAAPPRAGRVLLPDLAGLGVEQRRRACVQALLADQFGSAVLNDARFQSIVSRVTDAIGQEAQARDLIDRIVSDLGAA